MAKQKMLKKPLFDRIFKPELITLENGHTAERPRSRTPLIFILFVIVVYISIQATGFNLNTIISRANQLSVILAKIFRPNFNYFSKVVSPLIETIKMSIVGTIVGCIIGLPMAILASSNINKNKPTLLFFRFILSVLRSIPTLIYAYIFALIFSLGALAGTIAIVVFTIGIVAKMLYESIETIDMGPFEAMQSFGATTLQSFWAACMPQILPTYLDDCLYCFELNVRASSILGYVGAGGLGILIRERTGLRAYSDLGMILITLFVVVWLIDVINDYLRSKLS
ncbi:MAG: phosphonate ABC transporter, permease protein PhnE [Erysipelotrichaceae bacterium]|nr:phosphonate ABC transporter, permease protein PhnE [Erysipelotrichaceae bacterium]MDY6034137.1 phosphonate ABC transporter, permease protein PhnE [Bulleidia sp.]